MPKARILLADDHELFREGLAGLINTQPDLAVVGQAGDGFEALTLARDLKPDLIVMDITMPVCDGLEATRLIRAEPSLEATRIVMLTVHDENERLFEALKAGANSYMLKSMNSTDFLQGIRSALAGEAALPPKLAAGLIDEYTRLAARPAAVIEPENAYELTEREREVLSLIATGAANKEIATELALSLHTVKSHVRNILNKLHVANRRQAARLAVKKGLVDEE
jgi:two-component system nitrate/nitrite response regulator NarL